MEHVELRDSHAALHSENSRKNRSVLLAEARDVSDLKSTSVLVAATTETLGWTLTVWAAGPLPTDSFQKMGDVTL